MNRQLATADWIRENLVAVGRVRHDLVSGKLQVREGRSLPLPSLKGGGRGPAPALPTREGAESAGKGTGTGMEMEMVWRDMSTEDINSIVCQCAAELDQNITSREVLTALHSHLVPDVHPLREWLKSCRPYAPERMPDFIEMLSSQVRIAGGDEAQGLWRQCFKKWFVAMVASWLDDEVVNHQVLVLIGRQGIYKTTWLERLLPPCLRRYGSKLANTRDLNKDERLRVAEYGLINIDEIDSMSPRELNQLKSLITSSDVNERAAYAYTKERRVRLASFCASGNRREFLTDITGNRRWLPFEVESIQTPFGTTILYEQIYAQALWLLEQPAFSYWFDLEDIAVIESHNEPFRAQTSEEQLLPLLFDTPAEGLGEFLTTAQISERLVTYGGIKQPMALNRLGMLLGEMGFVRENRRVGVQRVRGWIVYERKSDELKRIRGEVGTVGTVGTAES